MYSMLTGQEQILISLQIWWDYQWTSLFENLHLKITQAEGVVRVPRVAPQWYPDKVLL